MKRVSFYYHGGSANHGCEAIVRASAKILNMPATLWSTMPDSDLAYGLNDLADIREDKKQDWHEIAPLQSTSQTHRKRLFIYKVCP